MNQFYKQTASSYAWALPFLCFISGYLVVRFFYGIETISMPKVVGSHLQKAAKILSDKNLNIRITQEKESSEVPEGTVLSQVPVEGQKVKPYQSVFLVVSQRSSTTLAPLIRGLNQAQALEVAHQRRLDIKRFNLFSSLPKGTCLAQNPGPSLPLSHPKIIAYISMGENPYRLMPDLKGKKINDVSSFLQKYGIEVQIFHKQELTEEHTCDECIVFFQRPQAGTLVSLNAPFKIQLSIGERSLSPDY